VFVVLLDDVTVALEHATGERHPVERHLTGRFAVQSIQRERANQRSLPNKRKSCALVRRNDHGPFCSALQSYLARTRGPHHGKDTTPFARSRHVSQYVLLLALCPHDKVYIFEPKDG
jgi:hypothetical protein